MYASKRDADYNKIVDIIACNNMVSDVVLDDGKDTYETHNINNNSSSPAKWLHSVDTQAVD